MLRQFHYIDQNGKDQGINVRNRSQELVKLLGDVDAIRSERKKARANRNKFGGIEGGIGGFSASGGRYGGFGSDSSTFGGYSGGVYGDGGGFGGNPTGFQDSGRKGNRFEEYDEDEDDGTSSRGYRATSPRPKRETKEPESAKAPEKDLFDFDDTAQKPSTATGKKPPGNNLNILEGNTADDDEFDDFQSAAPASQPAPASTFPAITPPISTFTTNSSTQFAAPKPVSGPRGANLNGLVAFSSLTSTPTQRTASSSVSSSTLTSPVQPQTKQPQPQMQPTGYQAATPNYFTSISTGTPQSLPTGAKPGISSTSSFSSTTVTSSITNKPTASKSSGGDAFGSLWSSASANAGIQKSASANKGPNLASMAKEKSSAGIWGTSMVAHSPSPSNLGSSRPQQQQQQQQQQKPGGSALDDLLG
jgi:epsin